MPKWVKMDLKGYLFGDKSTTAMGFCSLRIEGFQWVVHYGKGFALRTSGGLLIFSLQGNLWTVFVTSRNVSGNNK